MSDTDPHAEDRAVLRAARLSEQITEQAGVVTRAQLRVGGLDEQEIRRRTRRRELVRVHPRVYVTHTGPLTWEQRAWAAVLYAGRGAALCAESLDLTKRERAPIHVAIDQRRRVTPTPGIVLHRVTLLEAQVFPGSRPARLRFEDNALSLAGAAGTTLDAIGVLGRSIGRSGVTPKSLAAALPRHPRLRRRRFIAAVVDDLAAGACSVLEHAYLTRVERAHGLPPASRQVARRSADGMQFRDAVYEFFGLVVELDGRLGHDSWAGLGRDADRDLDELALQGAVTARLRWQQVFGTPCRTAGRIARVLQRHGWTGRPHRCGPACTLPEDET